MNPRTCIGCRAAVSRDELIRLVWDETTGAVVTDEAAVLPGRGAWLHPRSQCVETALKRRALGRALRRPVEADQAAEVLRQTVTSPAEQEKSGPIS